MSNTKQTVLITGASSGIGLALANTYLREGFNVVANSRNILSSGAFQPAPNVALVAGDVSDESTAAKLVQTAIDKFGSLDILVNNAGIFVAKRFEEYTPAEYNRVVATNLTGFFYITQHAIRAMRKQRQGQILNITTTLVGQPIAGVNAALANLTKGRIDSATPALAMELAADNIRVNAIAPGVIDTPMHAPETHEFLKGLHPIHRLGRVDEITDAALYLTRAQFVTGEVLHVDGGAHAGKW